MVERWEEPPVLRRHWRELGYRNTDLLLFSVLWVGMGMSILLSGDPDPTHKVPLEYLGEPVRAGVWFVAAAIASATAFMRDHDGLGFGALLIPVALRVISYSFAWFWGVMPWGGEGPIGDPDAWLSAAIWGVITLIVYRAAKRPELPELPDDDGRWPWE